MAEVTVDSAACADAEVRKKVQDKKKSDLQEPTPLGTKVEFVIATYPDLQPFLEMTVVLLEGVYEYSRIPHSVGSKSGTSTSS